MKNNTTKYFNKIKGLKIIDYWRAANGGKSYVIPYASIRPINIVYHGEKKFDYGHYGVHLGQEDRLMFLGDPKEKLHALFVDFRGNSETYGNKLELTISPNSKKVLCIPPGIAHTFKGLENIYTVNAYKIFLPEPTDWLNGDTEWDINGDITNIPLDYKTLPCYTPNTSPASDLFYQIIAQQQKVALSKTSYMHPETEEVTLDDGNIVKLSFRKPIKKNNVFFSERLLDEKIPGLKWKKHYVLLTSDTSGIIPLLSPYPMYIVDHGFSTYSHDAYGIHESQEDNLTFLGNSKEKIKLHLVDCREGSPNKHQKFTIEFSPSPLQYLIIPPGVAHCFENLDNIYTVNRPAIFSDNWKKYDSANDVIDWSISKKSYPTLTISKQSVPQEFYNKQTLIQKHIVTTKPELSTPIVMLKKDSKGNSLKVAFSKRSNSLKI